MYDLLIKGGTVMDPAQGINGVCDVAIQDGKIALVAPDLAAADAAQVVEVPGKIVTPGLCYNPGHSGQGPGPIPSISPLRRPG